jgi:hypothetical protein
VIPGIGGTCPLAPLNGSRSENKLADSIAVTKTEDTEFIVPMLAALYLRKYAVQKLLTRKPT